VAPAEACRPARTVYTAVTPAGQDDVVLEGGEVILRDLDRGVERAVGAEREVPRAIQGADPALRLELRVEGQEPAAGHADHAAVGSRRDGRKRRPELDRRASPQAWAGARAGIES